jgi:hypothetical protein
VQGQLGRYLACRQPAGGRSVNRFTLERLRKNPSLGYTHQAPLSSSEKLAWVSIETREDHLSQDAGPERLSKKELPSEPRLGEPNSAVQTLETVLHREQNEMPRV